ncbi:hypothetical protein ACFUC1_19915 [Pedococcus sp. NPDC057267]|uniref:hypothetical protein n=1 Tax=Pedococcus sp. NPDC057267 TaxID=3346077 RepID=UPI00363A7E99
MNGAPSSLVSPGLWGFVAFFVLAIALYLLMRNMNARMRRMSYRAEELRKEAEAEAGRDRPAASRAPEADGPAAGTPGDGTGADGTGTPAGDGQDEQHRTA